MTEISSSMSNSQDLNALVHLGMFALCHKETSNWILQCFHLDNVYSLGNFSAKGISSYHPSSQNKTYLPFSTNHLWACSQKSEDHCCILWGLQISFMIKDMFEIPPHWFKLWWLMSWYFCLITFHQFPFISENHFHHH